jgi:hypothetical protein
VYRVKVEETRQESEEKDKQKNELQSIYLILKKKEALRKQIQKKIRVTK